MMKLLLLISLVSCQYQAHAAMEDLDITNLTLSEDYFDENLQKMTPENTQTQPGTGESGLERINENQVDDEVASAERQESYPVWKILLVVAGSAVGLVMLVGSVILVLKSRNDKEGTSSKEASVPKEDFNLN